MTQPLNYTVKAIEALSSYPCPGAPGTLAGMQYLLAKLRKAQVFVIPDNGELLDRSKVRPEVPGVLFKPPFPVVALEYTASRATGRPGDRYYNAACTKRIALAWEWQDDLPPILAPLAWRNAGPGVVVASIAYYDDAGQWMPVTAAMHIPYDDVWQPADEKPLQPYAAAAAAAGGLTKAQLAAAQLRALPIIMLPEPFFGMAKTLGGLNAAVDSVQSDVADEVAAYTDLCYALACKNVSAVRHPAAAALNKQRLKLGKLPLTDFHVLELAGGEMPGAGGSSAVDRAAARSHLRRGHIRRLAADRVTWVNSTIVRGRGHVDKVYAL